MINKYKSSADFHFKNYGKHRLLNGVQLRKRNASKAARKARKLQRHK